MKNKSLALTDKPLIGAVFMETVATKRETLLRSITVLSPTRLCCQGLSTGGLPVWFIASLMASGLKHISLTRENSRSPLLAFSSL